MPLCKKKRFLKKSLPHGRRHLLLFEEAVVYSPAKGKSCSGAKAKLWKKKKGLGSFEGLQ